ncbi:MAG: hypothetical protein WCG20_03185 [bacterium]
MIGILRFIRRLQLRIDARYYINQFLESNNGKKVIAETYSHEIGNRKKMAQHQLVEQWLPSLVDLQDNLNLTVIYQGNDQVVPQSTLLFDEVFRLPYNDYQDHEVENLIAIQVITALILSDQKQELLSNLLVFITEHDSDEFIHMSAYEFKVCKVSDFGALFTKTPELPTQKNSLVYSN